MFRVETVLNPTNEGLNKIKISLSQNINIPKQERHRQPYARCGSLTPRGNMPQVYFYIVSPLRYLGGLLEKKRYKHIESFLDP